MGGLADVYLILFVFALVIAICWVLVPFILLAQNGHLKRLHREQQRTNELLESLRRPRDPPARV